MSQSAVFSWCAPSTLDLKDILPPVLQDSLISERRDLMEISNVDSLSLCTISPCGTLHVLLTYARRSVFENDWTRCWSMSKKKKSLKNHFIILLFLFAFVFSLLCVLVVVVVLYFVCLFWQVVFSLTLDFWAV